MIHIKRPDPPPSYNNSPLRANQEREIDSWLLTAKNRRNPSPLQLSIRHREVPGFMTELNDCFDNKCPFCESKLDIARTVIFFYRPPYRALQEPNGQSAKHYYCWLIWEWSNLYPACEACARSKGSLFPVGANRRANIGVRKKSTLKDEEPFLLDPCSDNPDEHLEFHEDGSVTAKRKSEHGKKTIEILSLNRERLQVDRKAEASVLRQTWEKEWERASASFADVGAILQAVNQALQPYRQDDQPFAGMKRQLLERWTEDIRTKDIKSLGERRIESNRSLRIFLCHAHSDATAVHALYLDLRKERGDVWLDKEKLLPGSDWELEIRRAVRLADVVVVCLSKQFNQAGFRQKEVRIALDTALEKPDGEIFIIPARLEECENLESLSKWHWVNLFEEGGYEHLVHTLRTVAEAKGLQF